MTADPLHNPAVIEALRAVDDEEEDRGPSSWTPVDLTDAIAGRDVCGPELLARTDGKCLLYRGRVHWVQGESESCKSWLALLACGQTMNAGEHVLWIDFEDDAGGVVARLLAMAVPAETIARQFVYVRPDEPLHRKSGGYTFAYDDFVGLTGRRYGLAVVDGVTEALTVEGLSLIDNADVARWLRLLPKRLADRTGAAVVCIDHVAKDRETQGRYAIGGQHKLAGVTGAAYRLEVRKRLRRTDGLAAVEAAVAVSVVKDRPGWVRAHAADGESVATFNLTAWPDGGISGYLTDGAARSAPDLGLCRRIVDFLRLYEGASGAKIEGAVGGKAAAVRAALQWLAEPDRGWVEIRKVGQTHQHYVTPAGVEEFGI